MNIGIIIASTRPGRNGAQVANWVKKIADEQDGAHFKLIDLAEENLPLLDEPKSPMMGDYQHAHTKNWAKKVDKLDGFIVVTPEYNHGYPASLKNALDYLYAEWTGKPIGFVGYGFAGGTRAIEQLIPVVTQLNMHALHGQVNLHIFNQMNEAGEYQPSESDEEAVLSLVSLVTKTAQPIYAGRA